LSHGGLCLEVSNMSERLISRRGAFSLLGLGAALGFAVPTTMLMESDAEAQMQPTAPAPRTPAPTTQPMQPMPNSPPGGRSVVRRGTTPARGDVRHGTPVARSVVRRGEKLISFT
jgi:hypothetical protein